MSQRRNKHLPVPLVRITGRLADARLVAFIGNHHDAVDQNIGRWRHLRTMVVIHEVEQQLMQDAATAELGQQSIVLASSLQANETKMASYLGYLMAEKLKQIKHLFERHFCRFILPLAF